jgi:hypothetical protein
VSDDHFPAWAPKELHQEGKKASQKGCLVKCKQSDGFEDGNECSYRWHAYIHAEIDSEIYNYPAYVDICISKNESGVFRTDARTTKAGGVYPEDYAQEWLGQFWRNKPTHEGKEWDLGHGDNFTADWRRPYWHNAHHVVPAGILKSAITATGDKDSRLPTYIGQGLLMGTYNLHDLENMIILPMDTNVAYALKLPRHLRGDQVGPGKKGEYADHKDYSAVIKDRLNPVMDAYAKSLAEALSKEHKPPPIELAKQSLVDVSKDTYKDILRKGSKSPGEAISDIFP